METLEMEEMRQQMMTLRQQLEKQVQVNDELVMKQLKKNVNSFKTKGLWMSIALIVATIPLYIFSWFYGISPACIWSLIAYFVLSACFNFYVTQFVKDDNLLKDNLSETLNKFVKIKRITRIVNVFDYILCFITVGWLFYEIMYVGQGGKYIPEEFKPWVVLQFLVLFAIGVWITMRYNLKQDKRLGEMIEMIREK